MVQTLERVCREVGYPKMIRVENGSAFISRDLDLSAYANDFKLDFSRPGKLMDNAYILRQGDRFTGSIAGPSPHSTASSGRNVRTNTGS